MIYDLDRRSPVKCDTDICIVGSGAAGLSIASRLMRTGVRVALLEGGGQHEEEQYQALNDVETDGVRFDGATLGRKRMFGGSTMCWGGQLLPLDEIDFQTRSWVPNSGWPIGLSDLQPYYAAVIDQLESGPPDFEHGALQALGMRNPFDETVLRHYVSKWTPRPRVRDLLVGHLGESADMHLYLHATALEVVVKSRGDTVSHVVTTNSAGLRSEFRASAFVIAAGGIETPRLLLTSRSRSPSGVGNDNDLVGRFFQDHPTLAVGTVDEPDSEGIRQAFLQRDVGGVGMTPRVSPTAEQQAEERILNTSAFVMFSFPRMILRRGMAMNIAQSVRGPATAVKALTAAGSLVGPTIRVHREARRTPANGRFTLDVMAEQEPHPDSRIALDRRRDRFGMPVARIRWHTTPLMWRSVARTAEILRGQFRQAGLGELRIFPSARSNTPYWTAVAHDMYHHMGATRMSNSPQSGVVDENCRVHGVRNLYVAGGSVFPTGGHSNCTLTIMALAARLADHLSTAAL